MRKIYSFNPKIENIGTNINVPVDQKEMAFPDLTKDDLFELVLYCEVMRKQLVWEPKRRRALIRESSFDENVAFVQKINEKLYVIYKRPVIGLPKVEQINRFELQRIIYHRHNSIELINGQVINRYVKRMIQLMRYTNKLKHEELYP